MHSCVATAHFSFSITLTLCLERVPGEDSFVFMWSGVEGKFLSIYQGMYEEVLSCVKELSDWFTVESGVKQGYILSPMLFGLFINDVAHHIDVGVPCGVFLLAMLMFADDIVLVAENECKLQCLLDVLHEWCNKWEVQINPKKTQVVHFRKKKTKAQVIVRFLLWSPLTYLH